MEIIHKEWDSKGAFVIMDEGKEAGKMTYSKAGASKIIIDHTEVNAAYNGMGLGKKLVMAGVEYARKSQIKILPLCPFARGVFARNKDLGDVLV